MTIKKAAIIASLGLTLFSASAPLLSAFATTYPPGYTTTTPPVTLPATSTGTVNKPRGLVPANTAASKMANLKTRADGEITRRISALNSLLTRINGLKRLTSAQKSTFTAAIRSEIQNLTNLKTKIDADTDLTTLQADVKSIVTAYRIFAFYMPQISILVYADRLGNAVDAMNTIADKLQTRLDTAKSKGIDTATAQNDLNTVKSQLSGANTQLNSLISQVSALTPSGYPDNKNTLISARNTLQSIMINDVKPARQGLTTIINLLRAAASSNTATPSGSK